MDGHSTPIPDVLAANLPAGAALCVAFSGGRDSTVLLHALSVLRPSRGYALRALHVNHGLQAVAGAWARHCADVAAQWGVPIACLEVPVSRSTGRGIEAAARDARYGALAAALGPGEYLLTAHHAADQLETVLLHLLRGSGVTGLAGMPSSAPLGAGLLCRPLLDVPPERLAAYAQEAGLQWVEDPMNEDPHFDRSYLRRAVLPPLLARWPAAARAGARSASLAQEAAGLLDGLAEADAGRMVTGNRIELEAFAALGDSRQRNLVRYLARRAGWPLPPERRLREGLDQLLAADRDRQPLMCWSGRELRRFRRHLYLRAAGGTPPPGRQPWAPGKALILGAPRGELRLEPATGTGLSAAVPVNALEVGFRTGGETLRPSGDPHERSLKYLFQRRGIVPWMRTQVPLIFAAGRLAAVGDLWIADWAAAPPRGEGFCIRWSAHEALS